MRTLILSDIGLLLTACGRGADENQTASTGSALDRHESDQRAEQALGLIRDGCVVVVDGKIRYAGARDGAPGRATLPGPVHEESVGGRLVTPGLVDAHTHLIWAGDRSEEFDQRNRGVPYQEIQARGGGILSTVRATTAASDQALMATLRGRLDQALRLGVTTCEVKTGYALSAAGELRLLQLIRRAAHGHPVRVSPTFLCHVPPPDVGRLPVGAADRQAFVTALCAAIRDAAQLQADAVDVYCDAGAFALAEADRILTAGRDAGLRLHCHAEQFTYTGVAERAAAIGASSVEHIEEIDDAGVAALAQHGVVANLLPGAVITLRLRWPDARRLIRHGVRVALGSDCNPGSSYTQSLPLMMSLACTQMGLSTAEAWLAVTRHAAQALRMSDCGQLAEGARGDLVVWEAEHPREICQRLGDPCIHRVWPAAPRQEQPPTSQLTQAPV